MAEYMQTEWGIWPEVAHIVAAMIPCVLILHVVAVGALVFIWMERKISGRIQDRLGPTRVGGAFGWLQTLADGIKLLGKEDLMPKDADPFLFRIAPYVAFVASFAAWVPLPFSIGWVAQHVNIAVFLVLAILGLEVFGVILAGYASGSKWSLFGAMREAAQVVSYEVPLGMCVVIPVFITGTMDLVAIGEMQAGLFTNWLIFHDPFTFLVFWVYFTCAVASVNRAPFDLAEAESELVAGFHTEYSGLRWSFFFMAEYGSMMLVSVLASILFLGAWNGPIPILSPLTNADNVFLNYLANLGGCVNLIFKGVLGVTVMIWVRWTLPRLRIDQVMTTCLKYCVPIAAFCFIGALGWQTGGFGVWRDGQRIPFINDMFPAHGRWEVREGWTQFDEAEGNDTSESVSAVGDGAEEPGLPGAAVVDTLQLVSKQDGGGG
ncbi:MAG: NADH-quinone oxidoreductase subunit NuoH [Pirellulaceae bacterium]|nr:NADH-quinone oxidoreductase subunit NuoH [Pirellulaceae bacterium]